jgi:hypothetical protein
VKTEEERERGEWEKHQTTTRCDPLMPAVPRALGGSRPRPQTAGAGATGSSLRGGGGRSTVNRGGGGVAAASGPIVLGTLPPPLQQQQQQLQQQQRAPQQRGAGVLATADDDEDFTIGPGPGGFRGVSSIGRQALSLRRTEAPIVFGQARDLPNRSADVPGPGTYERDGALGPQRESQFRTGVRYTMRSREKFGGFDHKSAAALPGPGQYRYRQGATSVVNLKERTPVTYTFRRGDGIAAARPATAGSTGAGCGPGSYRQPGSLGRQALSQRKAETAHAFKRGSRFVRAKRAGEDAGAEHFAKKEALGRQVTSQWRNEPAWGMGSEGRFAADGRGLAAGAPGPGRYSEGLPTALGKQLQSKTRNASAAFMSGRTAFGNPFGRFGRR